MNLRDAFKRDFNIDLPIGEGTGTRADPLLVRIDDPRKLPRVAEVAISLIVQGQSFSRNEEIFWKIVDRDLIDHHGKILYTLRFEKFIIKPETIENETVIYFFYAPNINLKEIPEPYTIELDPKLSRITPFSLSWLTYQGFRDYRTEDPTLGYSVGYGGPRATATLYAYSRDQNIPVDDAVKQEIGSTMQQLRGSFSATRPFLNEVFSPEATGLELRLDEGQHGLVVIDCAGPKLLKWRVTWFEDERRRVVEDFIRHSYQMMIQSVN